ncbi:hypothetical protein M436DRAFT_61772 [Aureobasidium namibiae CBS 147.97]|uniref:Uncharacterized protein n=1 Tax=Aureobasidium namibiae CBS 147.97 TaxID=1043004 RepID=A0A074WQB4_9PEZI
MAEEPYDSSIVSGRSPGTVCYVAALDPTRRTPSPEPFIETDHDPAFSLLLEEFESLKETFQKRSLAYGHLKYELRRVVAYFKHGFPNGNGVAELLLAVVDITNIPQHIVDEVSANRARMDRRQKEFFGSHVKRVKIIFERLGLLLEDNKSLLDKLRVLHYPIEETKHITRRDKLVQAHNNLDFLINDLCDEISIMLSSRLVAKFSK